jgi:AcrR family transcriptional regulator
MPRTYPQRLRREPVQARARELLSKVVETAKVLIGEKGADGFTMSDLATRSGVPIASIYQYLPDRTAVLAYLMEEATSMAAKTLRRSIESAKSANEMADGATNALHRLYVAFRATPFLRDLWSGTEANKDLRPIDIEASMSTGEWFAEKLIPIAKRPANKENIRHRAFLMCEYTLVTVRLACEFSDEAEAAKIMDSFSIILRREILDWAGES